MGASSSWVTCCCRLHGRTRSTVPTGSVHRQAFDGPITELSAATQAFDLDQETEADDDASEGLHQPACRGSSAARGEHVVDDEDPFAGMDRVAVDLQLVGAVFEAVLLAH